MAAVVAEVTGYVVAEVTVLRAGQLVTVAAHDVMVTMAVV